MDVDVADPEYPSRTDNSFNGRVALVTGASRGIGADTAAAFAQRGAAVVVAARDERRLADVAAGIVAAGGKALAVATDLTDADAIERLVDQTVSVFGRLDFAFNNAAGGGNRPTPLAETPVEDFDTSLAVNLRATFVCMKHEIAAMLGSGGGVIVNMSSTAGLEAVAGLAGYVSTKHGIIGLTKVGALDYAERGIRVNAVAPGPILTDRLEAAGESMQQRAAMAIPVRRIGRTEEVANAVMWLCSDAASFITGTTIVIDGGKLAGMAPFSRVGPESAARGA
jgi:NAD(P)-dependent dehydrogenase (short-subunit alcohol dehydrogenase family)